MCRSCEEDTRRYYRIARISLPLGTARGASYTVLLMMADIPARHTDDKARQMAEDVIAQLNEGQDFAELAREKSEDVGTKENGGLYTATKSSTVAEFYTAASGLSVGKYTMEPVKTDYGYHVIKLEGTTPVGLQPFAEVKEHLAAELWDQAKQKEFNRFMQEATREAVIVNKLIDEKQGNEE